MYDIFDEFVLRSPSLSFNRLQECLESEKMLQESLKDKQIREAIYIASPELYNELLKYITGELDSPSKREYLLNAVIRYFSRMSTRSTPFGLFAGCSVGKIGKETNIRLEEKISRYTRLDMFYLCELSQALAEIQEIKENIKYYPNNSIYLIGDSYRYTECRYMELRRVNRIAAVKKSVYLENILDQAKRGMFIKEIVTGLASEDITEEEAIDYVYELIDNQILISELSPQITGRDFLCKITDILDSLKIKNPIVQRIKEIYLLLRRLDKGESENIALYKEIVKIVDHFDIRYEEKYLFQVDMVKPVVEATIGKEIIEELQAVMTFMNKITPQASHSSLDGFKRVFYSRYENREIPLLEVLDPELGIGYPAGKNDGDISPLLDGFRLPDRTSHKSNRIHPVLWQKLFGRSFKKEIVISEKDVEGFPVYWDDLPSTMCSKVEIIKNDSDGFLLNVDGFGGMSAARVISRFAHVDDKLNDLVHTIVSKESEIESGSILAEIVHLPESRVGNILSRPHIRDYELLYLSGSDLAQDKLIYLSDLLVSVRQNKIVLRSKKLNKMVIPQLTNAHNFMDNSMPVYHFLCDLQIQGKRANLYFTWGDLGDKMDFAPRVRYRNCIISPAYWSIKVDEIRYLFRIGTDKELITEVRKWRDGKDIPQYTLLSDGDNQLFTDWESVLSIRAFFPIIKKRSRIKLIEFIFEPEYAIVRSGDHPYLNECVVMFYKKMS